MDIEDIYNIITNFLSMRDFLSYSLTNQSNIEKCIKNKRLHKILTFYNFKYKSKLEIISLIGYKFYTFLNDINDIWDEHIELKIYFENSEKRLGQITHVFNMSFYGFRLNISHTFCYSKIVGCHDFDDTLEEVENNEFINHLEYIYFDFLLNYPYSKLIFNKDQGFILYRIIHEHKNLVL